MKWNGYLTAAAFFFGIVIANVWGKELLTTYGILNTYFLKQYAYANINYDRLLYRLLWVRGKEAAAVLILGKIFRTKVVLLFLECLLAATFGILLVVAVANLGARGIFIMLGGVFPQWLFYAASMLLFFSARIKKDTYSGKKIPGVAVGCTFALLLFLMGILSEAYVNPVLWQKILKKF